MKKTLLASLMLCVLFVSTRAAAPQSNLCFTTTASVAAAVYPLGSVVNVTCTLTNCGTQGRNINYTIYTYGCEYITMFQERRLYVEAGQTLTFNVSYTSTCSGALEIVSVATTHTEYIAQAEASYIVQ